MGPIFAVYKWWDRGSRFGTNLSAVPIRNRLVNLQEIMMRAVHSSLNVLFKFDSKIGRFLGVVN